MMATEEILDMLCETCKNLITVRNLQNNIAPVTIYGYFVDDKKCDGYICNGTFIMKDLEVFNENLFIIKVEQLGDLNIFSRKTGKITVSEVSMPDLDNKTKWFHIDEEPIA